MPSNVRRFILIRRRDENSTLLIITGGASFAFMQETAKTLVRTIPDADHRILEGQTHAVSAESLAPLLIEFFKDEIRKNP
jgi:flagellar motor component MotA